MTAEFDRVLTTDARTLEVSSHATDTQGFVDLSDGDTTHRLDLVAARRLARVLLEGCEAAEPADPHPELRYAGAVEIEGKPWHLTIEDAMRLAKAALESGEKL